METQCNVLSYRINLYFYDYKLATKIDENGHSNKNIDYEIKRQKAKKKELGYKFIRIDPDKEDFRAISEIFRLLNNQLKKYNK